MKTVLFNTFIVWSILAINVWAEEPPVFDVHFAVITKNQEAQCMATYAQLRKEVDILNKYFVTDRGKPIVTFRFKSAHMYDEVRNLNCPLVIDANNEHYNGDKWQDNFNRCTHYQVRDPHAINIYIFDSHDGACHGRRNSNCPYIFFHYKRLNHTGQSPEEHEMGHCFGLGHECGYGLRVRDNSNIMTSKSYLCPKHNAGKNARRSGGQRNMGFYTTFDPRRCEPEDKRTLGKSQVEVILHHAKITKQRLSANILHLTKPSRRRP